MSKNSFAGKARRGKASGLLRRRQEGAKAHSTPVEAAELSRLRLK